MMRDHSLDRLRGLAALAVVVDHTLIRISIPRPIDPGIFGVALFFLISGYLMPRSIARYPSVSTFFRARIVRLWPPYVIMFIIAAMMQYAGATTAIWAVPWPNAAGLIANALMLPSIGASQGLLTVVWTLELEWVFYALLALLWRARAIHLAPLLCIAATVCALLNPGSVIFGVALFALGMTAQARPRLAIPLALPLCLIPPVALALLVFALRQYTPRHFAHIGTISYSLYLVHLPLLWLSPWCVLLTLPCAWVLYTLVERPSMRFRLAPAQQRDRHPVDAVVGVRADAGLIRRQEVGAAD
jgi:peptidoglycan/LPS O-acetylase OafA/YrhL